MRPVFILILAGLLACSFARAQEHSYLQFLTKDGLPGDNIYSIVQDKEGFIWIATETGLSRFDGSNFKNFTVTEGLPGNEIISLFVDHANRVWISAFESEPCYYSKGKIYNRGNSALLRKFPEHDYLRAMAEDSDNRLLMESSSGYMMIDAFDKCLLLPRPLGRIGFFRPLRGFHALSKDIIAPDIIAAGDSAVNYDYNFYNNKPIARCIFAEASDHIFVYDAGRLIAKIRIPPNNHSQYPINDSILVCNTTNGSYVFDIRTGAQLEHFLPGYWVNHTYIDEEGGTWIGTSGSGLFYFPAGSGISVRHTPSGAPLQPRNFFLIGGELITGTSSGTFWKIDKLTHELGARIDTRHLASSVLRVPEGNIIKPFPVEFFKLPELRGFASKVSSPKSLANITDTFIIANYNSVLEVVAGNGAAKLLWIGRSTGALKWNSHYYIGTLKAMYCFPAGDTNTHKPSDSIRLLSGNIGSMAYTTNPKMLWVATSDNGVYCIDSNNKIVRNFNAAAGLSGNICKCIFTDGRRVFVGTNNGLNVIDPSRGFSLDCYYTLDGLASNDISCIYAESSRIWIGTPSGYSFLNLDGPDPDKFYCRFGIMDVLVSGKSLSPDTSRLVLSPADNNIEFHFSGISFRSMGRMKYTYRLSGLERNWQAITQNYLRYPSLPAGKYHLEIYATNRYGKSSPLSVFSFTVRERWWRHWWVQAAGIFLLLGMGTWALWLRHARMRRREREKAALRAQITDLEQMALRAQMNPHFIFNSLNSFYQYVIHKDLPGASKFMGDFSTLLRLVFEITAQKEITLDKELLFLRTYLELERTKLRERFDYTIEVAEALPHTEDIRIPTFTVQPFVENSIRHGIAGLQGRRGRIAISFSRTGDELLVRIEDNGIGREQSKAQKEGRLSIQQSRGMALTSERISLYNKSNATNVRFEVNDISPDGTLVIIHFPLQTQL